MIKDIRTAKWDALYIGSLAFTTNETYSRENIVDKTEPLKLASHSGTLLIPGDSARLKSCAFILSEQASL